MAKVRSLRGALRPALQIAVILAITCALVELGARAVEQRWIYVPNHPIFFWHMADPYLAWRNDIRSAKRVGLPIDERGYQVYHGKNAAPDAPTVLCIGDSGTLGIWSDGMVYFDSYAEFLADDLACTIVNTGTIGYTSWHAVRVLKEYDGPLDAVVVRVGWNDHAHGNTMELRNANSQVAAWLRKFATGRLLLSTMWRPQAPRRSAISLEEFKVNLSIVAHIAREKGAPLFYIDYPVHLTEVNIKKTPEYLSTHEGVAQSIPELEAVHKKYVDATRAIAKQENQHFVETPLSSEFFSEVDAVHPNAEGARKTANYIAQAFVSAKLPRFDKASANAQPTP